VEKLAGSRVRDGEEAVKTDLSRIYPANYDAHARSVAADAYWQQVRRTVNGTPVSEAQIGLIVTAITTGLSLTGHDVVLDLACGNGALSSYLFDSCAGLLGIDISPYLIAVAQRDFARLPNYHFKVAEVVSFLRDGRYPSAFTKVLIYGAFQYFPQTDSFCVLRTLHEGFPTVTRVFIGNVPDRARVDRAFASAVPSAKELDDHEARIGVWYQPEEIAALARAAGWRVTCSRMSTDFYLSNYRFDVTLDRAE
jgi:SAM-dependent methyltransferase